MEFQQAIRSGFQNYTNFADRSCRSEFWYWVLFGFIVSLVASFIDVIIGFDGIIGPIQGITGLALLLPNIAMAIRRLHDIGKSGWFILIGLIPVLGWIYLIYLYVQPTEGPNQYGQAPLAPPAS